MIFFRDRGIEKMIQFPQSHARSTLFKALAHLLVGRGRFHTNHRQDISKQNKYTNTKQHTNSNPWHIWWVKEGFTQIITGSSLFKSSHAYQTEHLPSISILSFCEFHKSTSRDLKATRRRSGLIDTITVIMT